MNSEYFCPDESICSLNVISYKLFIEPTSHRWQRLSAGLRGGKTVRDVIDFASGPRRINKDESTT